MSAIRGEDFKSKCTLIGEDSDWRTKGWFGVARPGLEPGTN
jgi:hypothetical protein